MIFCIFIAILIRLPYVSYPYMIASGGDASAIGLMITDIALGNFYTFYYGQAYNGPIEAYIIIPFAILFGFSKYVFFSGAMFIFILFLASTYLLVKEFNGRRSGVFALLYCIFPPFYFYRHNMELYGYQMTILILGNIILLTTLKICTQPKKYFLYIILGLAAGLGFWNHYSIIYYIIPSFIFLVFNAPFLHLLKGACTAILPFLLGSMPWWIYNIKYNFRSLNIYDGHPCVFYPVEAGWLEVLNRFITFHIFGILGIDLGHVFGWILLIICAISVLNLFFTPLGADRHKAVVAVPSAWRLLTGFTGRNKLFIIFLFTIIYLPVKNKYFVWFVSDDYRIAMTIFTIMPLAVAVLASRLKIAGNIFMAVIICINGWYLHKGLDKEGKRLSAKSKEYSNLIKFFNENKIKAVIGDYITTQDISFITQKKIIGSEIFNGRSPKDLDVDVRDRIAFMDTDWLTQDINRLCYKWRKEDNIIYDFVPFPYYGSVLDRSKWQVRSNSGNYYTRYAIDGDLDKTWISDLNNQVGAYYEIDLGDIYEIYKISVFNIAPHLHNHPNGYKIKVSIDGIVWNEAASCAKMPGSLFWSGPRLYWDLLNGRWEHVFSPVKARFVRITQLNCGSNPWMINEINVYKYQGQRDFKIKDYVKDARKVYNFLIKNNIKFIYGDHWISNKIRYWSRGKIGTLQRYNECWPGRENTSRMMKIDNKTATVVSSENDFKYSFFPTQKIYSGNLYWTGNGWARINNKNILGRRLIPKKKMNIEFTNGVRFKGYSARVVDKKLQINYFWEAAKNLKEYTVAFVHFEKDDKRIFQNDHQLAGNGIFVERYWLKVPEPGVYKIQLGLYTNKKRIKIKGSGLYKTTKINIGKVRVNE